MSMASLRVVFAILGSGASLRKSSSRAQTCSSQWNNNACVGSECYTCGARITYVMGLGVVNVEAENQVATQFPSECGGCGCGSSWGTTACSGSECYTCGQRVDYLVNVMNQNSDSARQSIASEFPSECGACSSGGGGGPAPTPPAPTPPSPGGSNCLCVFDIDRTLTGKQGDTWNCPRNRNIGLYDAGYGGGDATLSALSNTGINSTFCNDCYLGICSAGAGSGENSQWNAYILNNIMRSSKQDQHPEWKTTWSYGTNVRSPWVLSQGNRAKQHSVEGIRQWYGARGIGIDPNQVFFYGDRTENIQPFSQYGLNSYEISCGSRDWELYGGSGLVGYCGATPEEIVNTPGNRLCR